MKKRGFGVGKWNGPGGKPDLGETLEEAAIRELKEEVGIKAKKDKLLKVALLHFYFPRDKVGWDQDVHVYLLKNWEGEAEESEEMKPEWFKEDNLPFDQMWRDDRYWMPEVFSGRKIEGYFIFGKEEKLVAQKVEDLK